VIAVYEDQRYSCLQQAPHNLSSEIKDDIIFPSLKTEKNDLM
jgi:hypothetical protein